MWFCDDSTCPFSALIRQVTRQFETFIHGDPLTKVSESKLQVDFGRRFGLRFSPNWPFANLRHQVGQQLTCRVVGSQISFLQLRRRGGFSRLQLFVNFSHALANHADAKHAKSVGAVYYFVPRTTQTAVSVKILTQTLVVPNWQEPLDGLAQFDREKERRHAFHVRPGRRHQAQSTSRLTGIYRFLGWHLSSTF